MSFTWVGLIAALIGTILGLLHLGHLLDKETDPLTLTWKLRLGRLLSGQGARAIETRLQETNQTFFFIFHRLFSAKESTIEQSIWAGLLLAPVILAGIRMPIVVGGETQLENASTSLLFAIVIAISVSYGVGAGRFVSGSLLRRSFDSQNGGLLGSLGGALTLGLFTGVFLATRSDIGVDMFILLGTVIFFWNGIFLGATERIGSGTLVFLVIGIFLGIILVSTVDRVTSVVISLLIAICVPSVFLLVHIVGRNRTDQLAQVIRLPVHPVKALCSSLFFIVVVGAVASLIRADAATSFYDELIIGEGLIILVFVAFNMFADGLSLLETRWVLERGGSATVPQLLGLLVLDLSATSAIFLFLPAIVGEIGTVWEAVWLQGDRPWLGILFWSTFGTSVLFHLFVISVFVIILPGPLLGRAFRGVIGWFSSVEERPFTSIAYVLIGILLMIILAKVIWALLDGM